MSDPDAVTAMIWLALTFALFAAVGLFAAWWTEKKPMATRRRK